MKFVYTGTYIQVRGRMFAFGNPVEVTDKATIEELTGRPDFRRVEDVKEEQKTEAVLGCPKCGKVLRRGMVMHQRFCKG